MYPRTKHIIPALAAALAAVALAACGGRAGAAPIGVAAPWSRSGPLVVAAGDIACDPADAHFSGGRGATNHCQEFATAALAAGLSPAAVLALGDDQYECGGYQAFVHSYGPSWGRLQRITYAVPGNQEYGTSGGTDCDQSRQAAGYFRYFGAAAGPPGRGYYSFDLGGWHLIALNANCSAVDGCGKGSEQERWLEGDLQRDHAKCTLAFWHQPRFSSGSNGNDKHYSAFWEDLYRFNADVVLNGHDHDYERFAPQAPDRTPVINGITEFVVGTGGEDHGSFSGKPEPNSVVRNADTFGVLALTLRPDGFDWSFAPVAGGTFSDHGARSCH